MVDELKMVTIEGVELAATGYWDFSTGPRWLEQRHLEAAVEAQNDPALKTPIIKIGHSDPRFDGNPLFGSIVNLRLSDNKQKLLGDYVIAASLAPLVAKAPDQDGDVPYPDRSIEGWFDAKTATGNEYAFVLTGVALLGEQSPAIEDLEDIVGLFTDEDAFVAAANAGTSEQGNRLLLAGTTVDKIRLGVHQEIAADDKPWGDWSWVRHLEVENGSSGYCIVEDDDTAQLFRVDWKVAGDEVEYGKISEVKEQYVAASAAGETHSSMKFGREIHNGGKVGASVSSGSPDQKEPHEVDLDKFRKQLGLPEDADDATVEAAALKALAEKAPEPTNEPNEPNEPEPKPEESEPEPTPATPEAIAAALKAGKLPEGVVIMDKAQVDEMRAQAKEGKEARDEQRRQERDTFIGAAVKAGKFPPARKDHYEKLWDKDPEGTKTFIESLEAGAVPVTETGHSGDGDGAPEDDAAYKRVFAGSDA